MQLHCQPADALYLSELKERIRQLIEEVQQCQQRCPDEPLAQAVKHEVARLLDALKVRGHLPYDAQALERPDLIRKCHSCETQDLVTRMTPVTGNPSGTQGYLCARCARSRTSGLWYA